MKSKIVKGFLFVSLLNSLAGLAQAYDGEEGERVYYRCEAFGRRGERDWVRGEGVSSSLQWAERWALTDCQRKGGVACKINHCFRERAELPPLGGDDREGGEHR